MDIHKKDEFLGHFQEFIEEYLHTPEGKAHIESYERMRAEGASNPRNAPESWRGWSVAALSGSGRDSDPHAP